MAKNISNYQTILVTGCAGFIGSKIAELLLKRGDTVVGIDNLNNAYAVQLKDWRLVQLQRFPGFEFERLDITNFDELKELFQQYTFDAVMNLAARGAIAALSPLGFEVINLGSDQPVKLNHVIHLIEQYLGKKAQIEFQPRHPADVPATWADISKAKELLNWRPEVNIEEGIQNTVEWYLENREWVRNVETLKR